MKDLYSGNYKIMLKDIKEYLNLLRFKSNILLNWEIFNIIKLYCAGEIV